MSTATDQIIPARLDKSSVLLRCLGFPIHRIGYRQAAVSIARFSQGDVQSLSKEVYPLAAELCGVNDVRAVERAIREVILAAWVHGDRECWNTYFPNFLRPPSNKVFISTLAEYVK